MLKGPIRQSRVRKRRVIERIYGINTVERAIKDGNRHRNRIKRSGLAQLVYVKAINRNIPST